MIYFDACYIAKFYLAEHDSLKVIACAQHHGSVGCVALDERKLPRFSTANSAKA